MILADQELEVTREHAISDADIRAAQITQLYSQVRLGMFGAIGAAFAVALLLWGMVSHERILIWLTLVLVIQIPRHFSLWKFHKTLPTGSAAFKWGTWFLMGSAGTALLFGLSAVYLFPGDNIVYQLMLGCILLGFAASTAVAHAPLKECYFTSVILTLTPILIHFPCNWGSVGLILSGIGVVFAMALLGTGTAFNRMIKNSIRLGLEKDRLLLKISDSEQKLQKVVAERTAELIARNNELTEQIGQKQEAERKLAQSEDRYRNLFTVSRDPILIVSHDGTLIDFNRAFLELFGYTISEAKAIKVDQLWQRPEEIKVLLQELERRGYVKDYSIAAVRKSGDLLHCLITSSLRRLQDGSVQYQSILRDVTDQVYSEKRLRESEQKFRDIVELLPQPVFEMDVDGRITFVSQKGFEIFGYSPEEFRKGIHISQILIPTDVDRAFRNLSKVMRGQHLGGNEYTAVRKDGSTFPVLVHTVLLKRGDPNSGIRGIVVDMTTRKEAERTIRNLESLYRSVIDNIGEVFYRADKQGNLLMVSPSGAKLLGYDQAEEMIGISLNSFWVDSECAHAFTIQVYEKVNVRDFECLLKRKDGSTFIASFTTHIYRDDMAEIQVTQGIIRDVTPRREAEQRIALSEERLRLAWQTSPEALSISRIDDGTYIDVNESYVRLTGFTREEVIGRSSLDLPFWANPAERGPFADLLRKRGYVRDYETTLRTKHGEYRSIMISAGIMTVRGEAHIFSVTKDIEDLKQAQKAVIESEATLRSLLQAAPIGIGQVSSSRTLGMGEQPSLPYVGVFRAGIIGIQCQNSLRE